MNCTKKISAVPIWHLIRHLIGMLLQCLGLHIVAIRIPEPLLSKCNCLSVTLNIPFIDALGILFEIQKTPESIAMTIFHLKVS